MQNASVKHSKHIQMEKLNGIVHVHDLRTDWSLLIQKNLTKSKQCMESTHLAEN